MKKYDESKKLKEAQADSKRQALDKAHQAVINALSCERYGLDIAQLQTKARLSHRTLNEVLDRSNHVKCENGLYFLNV